MCQTTGLSPNKALIAQKYPYRPSQLAEAQDLYILIDNGNLF